MPSPFGGHPRTEDFVEWAKQNRCTVVTTVRTDQSGRAFTSLEITGPAGGHAAIVSPDMNERLVPSQVAYLQRRLGIKTPFAATPEAPKPEETEFVQESGLPFDPPLKGEVKKKP